ncbi:hypothetical protein NHX12_022321 [Muraenolepis orangiensis]|uniref:Uncharacterized protein n=1 Tax=Muraenolepis orangiensis TaxID=630683 RepID=A0A9Q0IR63_9TELE|nr:hypothetical protein NHX12_022321 [Muraenolepis orangiensis]
MNDFDDEMNGIVTTIASNSNRAKRRKEAATAAARAAAANSAVPVEIALSPSSPSGSEPRLEAPPEEARHWCFTVLAVLRKVLHRAVNCCHIENPHYIDNYSRVTFPLSFVMVNLLYWTYYLYF